MRMSETRKYSRPTYDQASKIIAKFGSEARLARVLGLYRGTVYRWSYGRPIGQDGLIPAARIAPIQDAAERLGIELTEADWALNRIDYRDVK